MDVLYCDNHVLAIDKPAMLVTQATEGHRTSLEEQAKQWIKDKFAKPGAVFLHAVHRLDKEVSGIVLFARTSKALSRLNEAMREGKIHKTYHALVEGTMPSKRGTLEHKLEHGEHRAIVHPSGKTAILHYVVLEQKGDTALVEVQLETGRYHQIRAQLAAVGCPIVGDKKYGSYREFKGAGIALCHVKITFPHPISKEETTIESAWTCPT